MAPNGSNTPSQSSDNSTPSTATAPATIKRRHGTDDTYKSPRKRAPKAWLTSTPPSAATAEPALSGSTATDDTATAAAATDDSFQPSFLSQELRLSKGREKRLFSLRERRLTILRGSSDASLNKEILDPHVRIQHLGDVFLAATTPSVHEAVTERIQAAIKRYGTNQSWTPTRFERIAVTAALVGQYLDKEYARVSDEAEGSFQDTVRRRIGDRVSRLSPKYDKETSTLTLKKDGGPVQSINLRSSSLERKALIADVTSGGLLETVGLLRDTERSWAIDTLGMSDLVDEFNPAIYQSTGNGAAPEEKSWLWGLQKDRKLDMWLMEISAAMRAWPAWKDQVGSSVQQ